MSEEELIYNLLDRGVKVNILDKIVFIDYIRELDDMDGKAIKMVLDLKERFGYEFLSKIQENMREENLLSQLLNKNVEVDILDKKIYLEKTIEQGKLTFEISELVSNLIAKYDYQVI